MIPPYTFHISIIEESWNQLTQVFLFFRYFATDPKGQVQGGSDAKNTSFDVLEEILERLCNEPKSEKGLFPAHIFDFIGFLVRATDVGDIRDAENNKLKIMETLKKHQKPELAKTYEIFLNTARLEATTGD